jgi:hypothetical protein
MSAVAPSPAPAPVVAPATAPAPAAGSSFLTGVVSTLKLVVGMAASPGGLQLATAILGTAAPEVLLVEQFGVRLLGPLLTTWTTPTVTDADLTAHLSTIGYKVAPYDPMAAFR